MTNKRNHVLCTLGFILMLSSCYEIESIQYPEGVEPGSTFEIGISISVDVELPIEGAGPITQSYYHILLPLEWETPDSIHYTGAINGYYDYSSALTDSMEMRDQAPFGYQWWSFISRDTVDTLSGIVSFTQSIQTSTEPGLYFIDYRFSHASDPNYNLAENDNPIWVGSNFSPIAADVYVNVDGNDTNTGLSATDPLKTISAALMRISSDSLNHRKIMLADGEYKSSNNGEHYPLYLPSHISLIGESEGGVILDAEQNHIVIVLDSVSVDTLSNLKITGGACCEFTRINMGGGTNLYGGGGIYSKYSNVYLENVTIQGNSSDWGGGITSKKSKIKMRNVQILNNYAVEGGGINFWGDTLIMTDCILRGNSANESAGGAIALYDGIGIFKNTTITDNYAAWSGGGIYLNAGELLFDSDERCNIYLNQAMIGNDLGTSEYSEIDVQLITLDTFTVMQPTEFHASVRGTFSFDILNARLEQLSQDIYVDPLGDNTNMGITASEPLKSINVANSIILGNHTIYLANGIYSPSTSGEKFPICMVSGIDLVGEAESDVILDAEGEAGTFYFDNDNCELRNLTITGGTEGGVESRDSYLTLDSVTVTGNTNSVGGGGLDLRNELTILNNVTITNNEAGSTGGVGSGHGHLTMNHVLIENNTSNDGGGGLHVVHSTASLNHVTIIHNSITSSPMAGCGGIYNLATVTLNNSIVRDNIPNQINTRDNEDRIDISYSNIQQNDGDIIGEGAFNWLNGNINADPLFCNPIESEYQLAENSPCVGQAQDGSDMGAFGVGCLNPVNVEEDEFGLPIKFALNQNYPNPFNPTTTISYDLPEQSAVNLTIFNVQGRQIASLQDEQQPAGSYHIKWSGINQAGIPVSTGVYFARLNAGNFSQTIKMLYLK
ncbi:MAG: T9SS type A sorting domain-containing protein [Candidatus Marinimicrobia bacterium]|nr:T9SS type A sorting domain-containing protein [Candidatus Neomarinimicrobiota bacterium]